MESEIGTFYRLFLRKLVFRTTLIAYLPSALFACLPRVELVIRGVLTGANLGRSSR